MRGFVLSFFGFFISMICLSAGYSIGYVDGVKENQRSVKGCEIAAIQMLNEERECRYILEKLMERYENQIHINKGE